MNDFAYFVLYLVCFAIGWGLCSLIRNLFAEDNRWRR